MILFRYDKTWEGFLTAVYYAYARRQFPDRLIGPGETVPLFCDEVFDVCTDEALAARVWKGLERKVKYPGVLGEITACWLSEMPVVPDILFRYFRKIFGYSGNYVGNLGDEDVLQVHKIARKVLQERLRVIQFLRFQKTADGIYASVVAPLYNVLPLTLAHLSDRFASQTWLVYDRKRKFGYFYDQSEIREVSFAAGSPVLQDGHFPPDVLDGEEMLFQEMWQTYFRSIAIRERINPRLQRQNMPARFWPYLTEIKQI